ncbi:MAG TPA: peptidoglycan endopeptidase, partial [Clostridia bacterium]|nr:peptidoglycan endopeptidase [Clostridia bacterium]
MANPVLIAKAAAMALSDERTRKGVGWMIVAVLSPFIIILVIICGVLSRGAHNNKTTLDLCFHRGAISANVPENYRKHIEDIRNSFAMLDRRIAYINA